MKDTKWCAKFTELCGEMCVRTDNKHLYNCIWCDAKVQRRTFYLKGANISNDGYPIIISESNVLQDIIQHHEVLCDERGPHSVQGSRAEVGLTPSPESFLFCFVKLNFFFFLTKFILRNVSVTYWPFSLYLKMQLLKYTVLLADEARYSVSN